MNITADAAILLLGGFLVLIAVIGGGFEVKELKIPQISLLPRIVVGIVGIALIITEFNSIQQGPRTNPAVEPRPFVNVDPSPNRMTTLSIADTLGEDQVSEKVRVIIEGSEKGILNVSEDYKKSHLEITVPSSGSGKYDAVANFRDADGRIHEVKGAGQARIIINSGDIFQLHSTISGDNWTAWIEKVK